MIDLSSFNWVQLIKKSDLPANAKYIALYLSTFMNAEHNIAWPSQARISSETGLARSTVIKWIDYLHDAGWLIKKSSVHQVMTPGGLQAQNEYLINVPVKVVREMYNLTNQGCTSVEQRMSDERTKDVRQPDTNNNRITIRNNNTKIPTLSEVISYVKERGSNVDPHKFYDYFNEGGWIDSQGKKVRNWKQKLITWEKHSPKEQPYGKGGI